MEGFKLEMEQELQTLRFELEDEGKAMLGIVFSNLHMGPKPLFLLMHMYVCAFTRVYYNSVVNLRVVQCSSSCSS